MPEQLSWDAATVEPWAEALEGAQAVVNLAGKCVDCRPTAENRREIIDSRVRSVEAIGRAIAECERPPRVWVQASSLAIYGDRGNALCDESTLAGEGFAAEVCKRWEGTVDAAETPQTRKVILRIGAVFGRQGVAMRKLLLLTKLFLGGSIGAGRQWISWLHPDDMTAILLSSIEREDLRGVLNATGPNPVMNAELMREIRRATGRPWAPSTPGWLVRIGAGVIGTDAEVPLTGRRCLPQKLLESGFTFQYPFLRESLEEVLGQGGIGSPCGGAGERLFCV